MTARGRAWWRCPNDPPCEHAGLFHDVYDDEDEVPTCCVGGCTCGHRPQEGPITRGEYAALRRPEAG